MVRFNDGQTSVRPNWSPAGDQIAYFSSSVSSRKYSVKFLRTSQDLPTAAVKSLTWGRVKTRICPDSRCGQKPEGPTSCLEGG